jgi:hypothetical protein
MIKKSPLIQIPLKYAVVGAALACILLAMLFFNDRHPFFIPVVYDFRLLLIPLFVFFAIKEYRDYAHGGALHFWEGMLIGIIVYLGIGVFVGVFLAFFGHYHPPFLEEYIRLAVEQLQGHREEFINSISEETYNSTLENLPLTTIGDLAMDYLLKCIPIGLFSTIIISVILRKQTKP